MDRIITVAITLKGIAGAAVDSVSITSNFGAYAVEDMVDFDAIKLVASSYVKALAAVKGQSE